MDRDTARRMNLADFYPGHDTDPLAAPPDFVAWRAATSREQSLFQQPLLGAAGPRTTLEVNGAPRELVNMASLDYLGLNRHPRVVAAAREALEAWGTGACGVPLLSGTTRLHRELEAELSRMLGRPSTLLFPSGFSGGVGLMSALLRRGDVALADEKAHMCWLDGIRQSGAQLIMFPHQDVAALDALLEKHRGARRLVVVDGLYSMDGDLANLPALLEVCEAHGVGLVVDEAHSIFSLGESGGGATELLGAQRRVRLLFGTLSKSLSNLGGFVSGDEGLLAYARLYAHPFGFSAALPPAVVAGALAAVRVSFGPEGAAMRRKLAENASYFREGARAMGLDTGASTTHVVPLIVGSERELLYDGTLAMLERGLYIVPIDYPAVPEDSLRLRAAVSAGHSRADLDQALNILEDCVARPLRQRRAPGTGRRSD